MGLKKLIRIAILVCFIFGLNKLQAQEAPEKKSTELYSSKFGNEVRGKNVFTAGIGSSVMNGDLADPIFEIYFNAGYKRFLGSYFNIGISYHKFNLAYKDIFNEGFMSFDLNLEAYLAPYSNVTPFLYVGGGLNASNYFKQTDPKVQVGGGVELLALENFGVSIFADYNHVFTDTLEGVEFGDADDIYWRMGLGINWYFGKKLINKKTAEIPSVINTNPIVDDY